jgi:hypothetical protein
MNHRIGRSAFTLMMLLMLTSQLNLGQIGAQEAQSSKKRFSVVGYYPWPVACHPVLVRAVSIGAKPPEVLTAQVTIQSFSATPVTAVKLRWNVYRWDVAMKKRRSGCDGSAEPAETFLSGTTPLIWLGQLAQKETCNISTYPLFIRSPATKTVFVEQPIIAWDQVKPLTFDGTRSTFKDDYAALIYVSEIHFEDGTKWTGEIK